MDIRTQYFIIVASIATTMFLAVAMFPSITALIFHLLPPSPPPAFNNTANENFKDQLTKSLQAQDLAVAKNATKCLPIYGMHDGVLCLPQNQALVNKVKGNGNV